jgi:amidase
MAELWQTWLTFRHWIVRSTQAANYADPARRALMKPEAIWVVVGGD